ncbi:MAG: hypothetical protein Q7K65_05320 [Candidatus Buchananbacteria bacterium]|nr:hypothetical protein [Candidatus Buchananbacteria bacterium]
MTCHNRRQVTRGGGQTEPPEGDESRDQFSLATPSMGILETLIIIFLGLFLIGLIISVALWLMWLFLILAIVLFVVRLTKKWAKKLSKPN